MDGVSFAAALADRPPYRQDRSSHMLGTRGDLA